MNTSIKLDSFHTLSPLTGDVWFYSFAELERAVGVNLKHLPVSLKVLLENLLRHEDGGTVTQEDIEALARWPDPAAIEREVSFYPWRVLMPDSSGLPLLIDLAAMRDAMSERGLDPNRIDPMIPTDLVIDHSVRVDFAGRPDAALLNLDGELERNTERYGVVKWAMGQFQNLHVMPPGNGIVHQINIEHLAQVVVQTRQGDRAVAFPDSLVGMDSHTPMVNALGVFGWGVGGIEAATAMFGQPVGLPVPRIVGCKLTGAPKPGVLCTDIVLTLTKFLRASDVLAAVVEFCGPALDYLSLPDRATIANMAAEYGATMGFFPVDSETLRYLRLTGRSSDHVDLVEQYARAQGLWRSEDPSFLTLLEFDLGKVEPSLAGPSRPENLVALADAPQRFRESFADRGTAQSLSPSVASTERALVHGDLAIAAIASCTNTANPYQVIAAGLLARNALRRNLRSKPWVKTSFSPGSRVVPAMLERAGLSECLDALGFQVVGFGCMACGSGSGPLKDGVAEEIAKHEIVAAGIISSNRNFDGRLNASVRGTFLGSPPLVVAYALSGSILTDLTRDPLGYDDVGGAVFLSDIWPTDTEIRESLDRALEPDFFREAYRAPADIGVGWEAIPMANEPVYKWNEASMFVRQPPFLAMDPAAALPLQGARLLLMLGDNITTDHISPGGSIPPSSEAGQYLANHQVPQSKFGTYVSRRANHEVMVRGTFANLRLQNELVPDREGGVTRHFPSGDVLTIFAAAERYQAEGIPVIVIAGCNYGCGSSRDWAAKGSRMLNLRVIVAESFERIHRSNLVGMGIVPLQFPSGMSRKTLDLRGDEVIDIPEIAAAFLPGSTVMATLTRWDGSSQSIELLSRIDTRREAEWVRRGGVLSYVLEEIAA
jgi:aconitate hydratase